MVIICAVCWVIAMWDGLLDLQTCAGNLHGPRFDVLDLGFRFIGSRVVWFRRKHTWIRMKQFWSSACLEQDCKPDIHGNESSRKTLCLLHPTPPKSQARKGLHLQS